MDRSAGEILTVGHSTRAPGELERVLRAHGVEVLLDVRAHPGSRRMPHFGAEALERSLGRAGIAYVHLPELGGRRRPAPDSENAGWRNESFRGYADHMASEDFERGLARAMGEAAKRRACLMCAEAPWWRCHRRLVADALVARDWRVLHVAGEGQPSAHEVTDFAVVRQGRVLYPPAQGTLDP
ncbi:MAG TPA: DUF488 domain-containing protein [Thermoleophilaceae bacterium]|nr:DUF488 domain-containing protein [Thermoleophilaceae bacterium]